MGLLVYHLSDFFRFTLVSSLWRHCCFLFSGVMEKQRDNNSFFGGRSDVSCNSQVHPSHHFPVTAQNNGYPLVSTTLPNWVYCQQTPQNYFESWSDPGASVLQSGQISLSSGYIPIQVQASTDTVGLKVYYSSVCWNDPDECRLSLDANLLCKFYEAESKFSKHNFILF